MSQSGDFVSFLTDGSGLELALVRTLCKYDRAANSQQVLETKEQVIGMQHLLLVLKGYK